MTYVVTFEPGPIHGPGQLKGLRRFASFHEAHTVLAWEAAGRTGRVVDVFTLETVCPHSNAGFCWDTATEAERAAMERLHHHAFGWACGYGRDWGERYASAYASRWYREATGGEDTPRHSHDLFVELTGYGLTRGE